MYTVRRIYDIYDPACSIVDVDAEGDYVANRGLNKLDERRGESAMSMGVNLMGAGSRFERRSRTGCYHDDAL